MIQVDFVKPTNHRVHPYQELAAAVILRALLDINPGPNRKEQTSMIQEQARDFLRGQGEFETVRTIWCLWSGIRPEALTAMMGDGEKIEMTPSPGPRGNNGRSRAAVAAAV